MLLLNRVLTVAPGAPGVASRQGLGTGHRAGDPRAGRPGQPAGRDPVGPRRADAAADARRDAGDQVRAPEPAVGGQRLLRLPPVQPGQRPARRAGRRARGLGAGVTAPAGKACAIPRDSDFSNPRRAESTGSGARASWSLPRSPSVRRRPQSAQPGREAAGGDRAPAGRGDPDQRLALVAHRLPVLVPVRVLAADGAEVVDERLDRSGRSSTSAVPSTCTHAPPNSSDSTSTALPARGAGSPSLARSGYVEMTIRPSASTPPVTGDSCGRAVTAPGDQDHLVPGTNEVQQTRCGRRGCWWRLCEAIAP